MTARSITTAKPRHFSTISDSEHLGIIIIHQELALVPLLSIAENIFLGNEIATNGVIDWPQTFARTQELLKKVGLSEPPATLHHRHRRRQAAAGGDRQGAVQEGPAADPRRADRLAQRKRFRRALEAARWSSAAQGMTSIIISHKLNEIQQGRRPDHHPARRRNRRNARLSQRGHRRGPDHQGHGRPRDGRPLSAARAEDRRDAAWK